ncbi:MAG: hypothetical protein JSS39_02990, partial [Nitrospira sp.]|nr:hypothetical protein [Nitrospira sp.]
DENLRTPLLANMSSKFGGDQAQLQAKQTAAGTLSMPEAPLSVVQATGLLRPDASVVDLSQEPTYALVTTKNFTDSLATPMAYSFSGQDLISGFYFRTNPGTVPLYVLCATTPTGQPSSIELLGRIVNPHIIIPHQEPVFDSGDPFFIADSARIYFVQPHYYTVSSSPQEFDMPAYIPQWSTDYVFAPFYHPFARTFLRELEIGGVDRMMQRNLQLNPEQIRGGQPFDFKIYNPQPPVAQPYPAEDTDFEVDGAYSLYNWELFYHAPMFVASLLMQNQQYETAMKWLEYIFNPTDPSSSPLPGHFWLTKPFYYMNATDWLNQQIQNILTTLATDTQQGISDPATAAAIQDWLLNPFDPHKIARLRIGAYGKATVMKFLDNLIAWGDSLFSQYTMETVHQAEQLYVFADLILGPKPDQIRLPHQDRAINADAMAYAAIADKLDQFANTLVEIENVVVAPTLPLQQSRAVAQAPSLPQITIGTGETLLFCIPPNDQLLRYWETVSQRLYNIRHGLNIKGIAQPLALYAPAINPLLAAEGQAVGGVGGQTFMPVYRFTTYLQRAVELTNDVRAYGALILSALEKKDAERLAVLRANQELDIQTRMLDVRTQQVTEAQDQITALQNQKAVVQIRYDFYSKIAFMNDWETAAIALQGGALIANGVAVVLDMTSGGAHMTPSFTGGAAGFGGSPMMTMTYGGENIGSATASWASVARSLAGIMSESGGLAATMGGYQRRMDEWNLQANLAKTELTQIDSQIAAATDRLNIASSELSIQNRQIVNAQAVIDFLTTKYTNEQLYDWMLTQLTTVYTQAYQLAFGLAQQTESAFQYELGSQETFIQFGYWDSQHKGLTAGESLLFDLRRMEAQYLNENTRELELTKHVSLALTQPLALVQLLKTGTCNVSLDEALFDRDHPGHYFRRLRSVALTIPCVTGPYTGVNASLTLNTAIARTTSTLPGGTYKAVLAAQPPSDSATFNVTTPGVSIATSSGQNDAGLFDLNLRDERWLPFEGQGAISYFTLELKPEDNSFDFSTITDVILHVRYTARPGIDEQTVRDAIKPKPTDKRAILVSVRNTFGDAYYRFFNPADTTATQQTLTLPITKAIFPFSNLGSPNVADITVLVVLLQPPAPGTQIAANFGPMGGTASALLLQLQANLGAVLSGDASLASPVTPESFTMTLPQTGVPPSLSVTLNGQVRLDPSKIQDIVLIINYTIT